MMTLVLAVSCTPFDELENDPNSATSVPPSMLLAGVLKEMADDEGPWSEAQRDNQFWVISFDYYGDQDYNWGEIDYKYDTLANINAMAEEAAGLSTENKYNAIALFLKAYYYDYMTRRVGDIPLDESLMAEGENSIQEPAYDNQEEVYAKILEWLKEANTLITTAMTEVETGDLEGDFLYNGDLSKWQKAINSFYLRVLINLSQKASALNVPARFQEIINNPSTYPLFESNADNMQRVYGNEQNNFYVFNPGNYGFNRNRNIMGATFLDLLKERNDPRIYIIADPAAALYDANNPMDLNAYVGAETGAEQGPLQVASDNGQLSYPSEERYYNDYTGEPYILMSYAEQEFTIAEAINRGWVSGSAASHYNAGITASMQFYGVEQAAIDSYLSMDDITYNTTNGTQALKQILTQKYIAFFNNSARESYFNYRRTGIPTFDVGPSNNNGGRIPNRWKYPQSEFQNNDANINAALSSQYGGSDDINAKMWLID